MHGLEQLAGHHGNELGRYRNLIGGEHALNLADIPSFAWRTSRIPSTS
jgi:hypothetical protein